eukprot:scaffold141633_cov31-Tisochrysis_lutea.AAC.1
MAGRSEVKQRHDIIIIQQSAPEALGLGRSGSGSRKGKGAVRGLRRCTGWLKAQSSTSGAIPMRRATSAASSPRDIAL